MRGAARAAVCACEDLSLRRARHARARRVGEKQAAAYNVACVPRAYVREAGA